MAVLGICTVQSVQGAGIGFRLILSIAATDGTGRTWDGVASEGEAISGNISINAINSVAADFAKVWLQKEGVTFGGGDSVQVI